MKRTAFLFAIFALSCSPPGSDGGDGTSDPPTYADACDAMCSGLVVCSGMPASDMAQCRAECEAVLVEEYGALNPGCLFFQLDCFECYYTVVQDACDEAAAEAECRPSCIPAEFCPYEDDFYPYAEGE